MKNSKKIKLEKILGSKKAKKNTRGVEYLVDVIKRRIIPKIKMINIFKGAVKDAQSRREKHLQSQGNVIPANQFDP